MTIQPPSHDRVARFLDQLKMALPSQKKMAQAQSARLRVLFQAIAEFRREDLPKPFAPEIAIDPVRFSSFLADLQTGLTASRHDGSLLNIWSIAGLKRNEVRTSAVLGWVIDCNGSHGFGSAVLGALLKRLQDQTDNDKLKQVMLGSHYRVSAEHSSFGERDNRVDLAIEGANCVIFVEVKIDAPEGTDQLGRYTALARRKAVALRKDVPLVLYLNKTRPLNPPEGLVWMQWRDVARAIMEVVTGPAEKTVSGAVLKQFATHISQLH
jgi:hypothetical protein